MACTNKQRSFLPYLWQSHCFVVRMSCPLEAERTKFKHFSLSIGNASARSSVGYLAIHRCAEGKEASCRETVTAWQPRKGFPGPLLLKNKSRDMFTLLHVFSYSITTELQGDSAFQIIGQNEDRLRKTRTFRP